ncbi:helix-turn-helix domain-containing protein [Rhizobium leguminosarum]|uniref:Helix-turn-helix domain-containing protein n=1 Tax=Rhizobium leguminosarum TaxID=384 RepID=A0A6P0DBJ6_RHILE|nr:helix-turn-helix domain-containing protein [Rhizobium leguminosarum]ASS54830.1 AraC family transcriptional regulator [Rhizobium leguminosarum bv. viciae]AVC52415.1 bacterial regulatory helix-turn-helix, AraC family protein [Rhizobium leguminosarum bv. viciae]MBB4328023.1 AraC-like DNA-binding protein [Rhizobium leguminosarum]MBB4341826.1 AraC-like DNA-binding protein [Rhizobium leguminosarum]MBB4353688.1 AraC-like DNA-binding protein [Rhizobium leguminosarum]
MLDEVFPIPTRALIRQGGRACFYRLVNTSPLLIQVQSGTKIVMADDKALRLEAGAYGLLPDYRPLTMENIPKAPQKYQTLALPVPRQLFEEAYTRMGSLAVPSRPVPAATSKLPEEAAALFDYCSQPGNLTRLPGAIAKARLMELITWFALCGAVLGQCQSPRLEDRLRQMIESDTAFDWTLGQAARAFNMSEATLRRKLAAENTGYSEILSDTRMNRALGLIQTTTLPMAQVALEVGYDSPSQFAARFKERFGVNPRHVRGGSERFERIGAEVEHSGADALAR